MKTTKNTSGNTTVKMIVMLVLLFSGVSMFGQTTTAVTVSSLENTVASSEDTIASATAAATEASTFNMVSWFMGTKQTTNSNGETEVSSNSKKQMINLGIAPNRLLIKAFLKKASNYVSTVA